MSKAKIKDKAYSLEDFNFDDSDLEGSNLEDPGLDDESVDEEFEHDLSEVDGGITSRAKADVKPKGPVKLTDLDNATKAMFKNMEERTEYVHDLNIVLTDSETEEEDEDEFMRPPPNGIKVALTGVSSVYNYTASDSDNTPSRDQDTSTIS